MKNNTDTIRNSGRTSVAGSILALTLAIVGFVLLKNAGRELDKAGHVRTPIEVVESEPIPAPSSSTEEIVRYRKEVEAVLADYDREVARAAEDFRSHFNEGRAGFAEVRTHLPDVVKEYRKFGKVKNVVVAVATDKIRKTNHLGELVEADFMVPVFAPALEAAGKMDGAYAVLRSDLEQSRTTAIQRLEIAASNLPGAPIAPDLMKTLNERTERVVRGVQSAISTVAEGGVAIGVAGGLELAFIASTARSIATICTRVAAKATASAAAPAADGPLPFGDVIAVAGLAWTAYDIYELTRTMPRKLQTALAQSIDGIEADAIAGTKDPAKRVIGVYKAETDEMRRAAYAALKNTTALN
jgi:hypothetical protein